MAEKSVRVGQHVEVSGKGMNYLFLLFNCN